jgi:ubiquinol-cytochrome c reductase cytochrome b subunit
MDRRLPIQAFLDSQLTGYYAPKNFNIWYYFGALLMKYMLLARVFTVC